MKSASKSPSEVAKSYIDQTEITGNNGFIDREFDKKMRDVGFQDTHAWCAYFQELVFKEAYPNKKEELDKLFSASAVKTLENFKQAKYPVSMQPHVDALVVWQTYKNNKPHWTGHIGVVSQVIDDVTFKSIEGNTNDDGSREGIKVCEKTRKVINTVNGLRVVGFITIN